jgi:hypothetical protein
VFELVRTGVSISLDLGFNQPIYLAVHRNKTRSGITTIMGIGVKSPRTKCFTVYGTDVSCTAWSSNPSTTWPQQRHLPRTQRRRP